eukprot:13486579-Ditylum_brightwellii.AAC.1
MELPGRDMPQELGIDIDFKESNITWGYYQANMKSTEVILAEHVANIKVTKTIAENVSKILDDKYCK